jgi:hypothetical protein
VLAGNILVRQVGSTIHAGNNVGVGKDYTLWAKIDGVVKFERFGKKRQRVQLSATEEEHHELERRLEHACHPFWGSPFKAESELSSFGEQVERYACLYTDRVTNLMGYSPNHFFRGPRHLMAHD